MDFIKFQGLGNDFIVLSDAERAAELLTPSLAISLCRRGHGVGADGVMYAGPSERAALAMCLLNSDGSTPEMCGNGIRCLVKYAVDVLGYTDNPLRVDTPGGVRTCRWSRGAEGVDDVAVAMGPARFIRSAVPMVGVPEEDTDQALVVGGRTFHGVGVNTGNPHVVIFERVSVEEACHYGPLLEHHPHFPARTNVEFVTPAGDGGLDVIVWERGCGLTQACGTGATAAACAAVRAGLAAPDATVRVHLPGGTLQITVSADFTEAWMQGPAVEVYRGTLP